MVTESWHDKRFPPGLAYGLPPAHHGNFAILNAQYSLPMGLAIDLRPG